MRLINGYVNYIIFIRIVIIQCTYYICPLYIYTMSHINIFTNAHYINPVHPWTWSYNWNLFYIIMCEQCPFVTRMCASQYNDFCCCPNRYKGNTLAIIGIKDSQFRALQHCLQSMIIRNNVIDRIHHDPYILQEIRFQNEFHLLLFFFINFATWKN